VTYDAGTTPTGMKRVVERRVVHPKQGMKVLFVAPQTGLYLAPEEVQDIMRSGLVVTPLLGHVTSTQLIREIKNDAYDVLWFATHGEEQGVLLSDGLLSASELVPQVRERFRLVVLNTCKSLQMAQLLQEEANVDVICTILAVPDRQAYQTGSLLASALAKSSNIASEYQRSKPGGNRLYLYLAALLPSQAMMAPLVEEMRELRAQIEEVKAQLQRQGSHLTRAWVLMVSMLAITWPALALLWWQWLGKL
jgi:hypothetical protein